MIVEVSNETFYVPDGTYTAVIKRFLSYSDNTKVLVKIELDTGDVLVKAYDVDVLGAYPWNAVFKALNNTNTDDLVGRKVEIEIKNNTSKKTELEYSNIKKIRLLGE